MRFSTRARIHGFEQTAGKIDRTAVGEMSAVGQVHAENGISGLNGGKISPHVGLGTRMRLHVGVLRPEQLPGPLDGQVFGHVHIFAAPVVTLAGIAFGVFVGHDAALTISVMVTVAS